MKNLAALVRTRTPNSYHEECDPALMDDLLDEIQAFLVKGSEDQRILRARTPAQAALEALAQAKRIVSAARAVARAAGPLTDDPWCARAEQVLAAAEDAMRNV